MSEFDASLERNRRALPRLVTLLSLCAAAFAFLGGGLLIAGHARVAAVLYEASLGPSIEVIALDAHCDDDGCSTELVHHRPNGEVHRRTWVSEPLPAGTTRIVPIDDTYGGVEVPASCCRDDPGFPIGAAMLATGIGWAAALLPRRPRRADGTFRLNRFGRAQVMFLTAPAGLAVGLAVLALDLQAATAWRFTAIHTLPVLASVAVSTWLLWRSLLVVDGARIERTRPWGRRSVQLSPSTRVRFRYGLDGAVSRLVLGEGLSALRVAVPLYGSDDLMLRRALFHALVRHRLPGDHSELLRPNDLSVNLRLAANVVRRSARRI